jgi:hypothetical protein
VGRGTAPQAEGLAVAKKRGEARFRFVYETGGPWLPRMWTPPHVLGAEPGRHRQLVRRRTGRR